MKVAFSRVNITPKDYLGKSMAGYGRKDPCLGKLDNIHAYGVLININDEDSNLILISVDILKLPLSIVEYIKKKLISKKPNLWNVLPQQLEKSKRVKKPDSALCISEN